MPRVSHSRYSIKPTDSLSAIAFFPNCRRNCAVTRAMSCFAASVTPGLSRAITRQSSGRSKTPSTTLTSTVFAPIPRDIASSAVMVRERFFRSVRKASAMAANNYLVPQPDTQTGKSAEIAAQRRNGWHWAVQRGREHAGGKSRSNEGRQVDLCTALVAGWKLHPIIVIARIAARSLMARRSIPATERRRG